MYCCCTLHTYQHLLCIIAIVDCTNKGSAVGSFEDLGDIQKNITADIDQLQPPLDMVTVDQERELYKPNS